MSEPTKIEKRGFRVPVSEEFTLMLSGFERKGHWEETPLTNEDRELHARAVAAVEEVNSNPWVRLSGYDYDLDVAPLKPKRHFVPEETHEEHLARWIAAGRPERSFARDAMQQRIAHTFASGIISPESAFRNAARLTGAA
ncbi:MULTISPECIES: hypothetical protein [unclassified Microbacterium]|uniref:hypothetical protein n=1 Tax=unclassified Microbacterium TaxID=2609290 RepID=UPI001600B132|nr:MULTISPECIES: hypothetical protein [unclassified Microbacterium]MBT2484816.1 hypothetical protein [Microbacterium sp. ISL-108]